MPAQDASRLAAASVEARGALGAWGIGDELRWVRGRGDTSSNWREGTSLALAHELPCPTRTSWTERMKRVIEGEVLIGPH